MRGPQGAPGGARQVATGQIPHHTHISAIQVCSQDEDPFADCLLFKLIGSPANPFRAESINSLDFVHLSYRVAWPLNIVVDDDALDMYGQVFSFLARLRRAAWALNDAWMTLKVD